MLTSLCICDSVLCMYHHIFFLFSILLIFSPLLSWCFPFSVFLFTLILTPLSNYIPLLLFFLPNFSDCPYSPCILPLSSAPWLLIHSPSYIPSFPVTHPSTSHSATARWLDFHPTVSSSALLVTPCPPFQSQATRGSVAHDSNTFSLSPVSVWSVSPLFSCSYCLHKNVQTCTEFLQECVPNWGHTLGSKIANAPKNENCDSFMHLKLRMESKEDYKARWELGDGSQAR